MSGNYDVVKHLSIVSEGTAEKKNGLMKMIVAVKHLNMSLTRENKKIKFFLTSD